MKTVKNAFRDILFGVFWFGVLLTWDTLDSLHYLKRATGRIKTDKTTVEQLKGAVIEYLVNVSLSYLLMGVMAGIALYLLGRILHPERPRFWRWLGRVTILALISTVSHPDLVRSPPSGIVVPLLLCGACVGRLLGLGMLAGLTVPFNPVEDAAPVCPSDASQGSGRPTARPQAPGRGA